MSLPLTVIAIVFGFAAFSVLMGTVAQIAKMRSESKGSGRMGDEESRDFQALYRGFEELAKRVEALETILMDHTRKG